MQNRGVDMEAMYPGTTNFNPQPNKREEAMNTTTTVTDHLDMPAQGIVKENNSETSRQRNANGLAFKLIISGVLILAGAAVLKVTGLYDGIESIEGKIALVAVISIGYINVFRRGFYAR